MTIFNTKQKGSYAVGLAIAYYTKLGYVVSIPLNDSQDYDLIVDNGKIESVQVKFTGSKGASGNYQVSLRSISGTTRKEYKAISDSDVDTLFVVTNDSNIVILPIKEIVVRTQITITEDLLIKYGVSKDWLSIPFC